MNTYEIVVEHNNIISNYKIIATDISDAYTRIEKRMKDQHSGFTVINIAKIDSNFNYEISEAI